MDKERIFMSLRDCKNQAELCKRKNHAFYIQRSLLNFGSAWENSVVGKVPVVYAYDWKVCETGYEL